MSLANTLQSAISMEIYTVLSGEHREVSALFATLKAAPDGLEGGRRALFAKIYQELLSHAKAEQAEVYDKADQRVGHQQIARAETEHEEIERRLNHLKSMDVSDADWDHQLEKLIALVDKHVKEEEENTFEKMRRVFSEKEAEDMAKAFHKAKEREAKKLENKI